jgi:hypothetical protein
MLELPELGRVPRNWTMHRPGTLSARTALALLDAGHIAPNTPKASPASLVNTGLQRWLDQQTEGMKLMRFAVDYVETDPPAAPMAAICVAAQHEPAAVFIGHHLGELARSFPNLAFAVVYQLELVVQLGIPLFTPAAAWRWAHQLYWSDKASEWSTTATYGEGKATRAGFYKTIPTWACSAFDRNPISDSELDNFADSGVRLRPANTRDIAQALRALDHMRATNTPLIRRGDTRAILDPSHCAPPLLLRWNSRDMMARINDDRRHAAYRAVTNHEPSSCTFARQKFPEAAKGKPYEQRLQAFLQGIEPMFAVLRAADHLINLLGDNR